LGFEIGGKIHWTKYTMIYKILHPQSISSPIISKKKVNKYRSWCQQNTEQHFILFYFIYFFKLGIMGKGNKSTQQGWESKRFSVENTNLIRPTHLTKRVYLLMREKSLYSWHTGFVQCGINTLTQYFFLFLINWE